MVKRIGGQNWCGDLVTSLHTFWKMWFYLKWIPSHMGIYRYEIADYLAKWVIIDHLSENLALTFMEIFFIWKEKFTKDLEKSSNSQLLFWRCTRSCFVLMGKQRWSKWVYQIHQWPHKMLDVWSSLQGYPQLQQMLLQHG